MQTWTYEEIRRFVTECKKDEYSLLFLLAIYTGMRKGEILGLNWSAIDFTRKVIRIYNSLARTNEGEFLIKDPKNNSSFREIRINDFLLNELRKHKHAQEQWKKRLGEYYTDKDLVICKHDGMEIHPRAVGDIMKGICSKANVTKIRFHDIRHTHASVLISEGVDVGNTAKSLGHANPDVTTKIYTHVITGRETIVADVIENAIEKTFVDTSC